MRYVNDFRDEDVARSFIERIRAKASALGQVKLMEVCGTHTMAIGRYGIRGLLPPNVELISGPGCPVCVTPNAYLDRAIALGRLAEAVLVTFGDMMRVPGSTSSLEKERADGKDIRVVYSSLDAVRIAQENPQKKIIFLGIGFETTAPTIAAAILQAERLRLANFFVLCSNKTMPAPMAAIAGAKRVQLDGFLCPGHVSAVIGSEPYEFLAAEYGKACVIAGFEPLDVLEAIDLLLNQIGRGRPAVEIQYSRVVTREGNPAALKVMYQALEPCDAEWRGIGVIPSSGLKIREQFSRFDAESAFSVAVEPARAARGCICGEVMQGIAKPPDCPLFGSRCTPENPVGPCMVSSEGSCAAWHKYEHPFAKVEDL